MKKLCLLLSIIFIAGCMTVRTYEIEKPRTDTEIKGNRGVLMGTAEVQPKQSNLGPNRKISVIEVELGKPEAKQAKRVYVIKPRSGAEEDLALIQDQEQELEINDVELAVEEEYVLYTVSKSDTLQKISHKFYGTTRRWKSIYEANKNVLKSPDKLYPGTELRIPNL